MSFSFQVHREKSSKQESDHPKHAANKVHDAMDLDLNNLLKANHKETKSQDAKSNSVAIPVVDGDWPYKRTDLQNLGQVSALGMDSKHLIVFHRADRVWGEEYVQFLLALRLWASLLAYRKGHVFF